MVGSEFDHRLHTLCSVITNCTVSQKTCQLWQAVVSTSMD